MFTGGYKGLRGVTGGYEGLQGVTRGYKELQGVTGGYKGLQGVPGGFRGKTKLEMDLQKQELNQTIYVVNFRRKKIVCEKCSFLIKIIG